MKRLFIRPIDTQFYRDGRPFDAGVESEGMSVFPPYPRTVYGALRAAILSHHPSHLWGTTWTDSELQSVVGSPFTLGALVIRGPVVGRELKLSHGAIEILYPAPLDLVKMVSAAGQEIAQLVCPQDTDPLADKSDLGMRGIYPSRLGQAAHLEAIEGYLSEYYLQQYLTGTPPALTTLTRPEQVCRGEARIGIGRNLTRKTVAEGLLYAARHTRMVDDQTWHGGLVIEVEGDGRLLSDRGILRLGGDSRPAEWGIVPSVDWAPLLGAVKTMIVKTGRFKACLITPGLFEAGWYQAFLQEGPNGLIGRLPLSHLEVQLVGACVGRAIPIGGFDLVAGYPKPIRKAVPAGSVYFFRLVNWDRWDGPTRESEVEKLLSTHFHRVLDEQSDPNGPWKEGFGMALIGGW